jgi:predicted PurR-regulated permease PerM
MSRRRWDERTGSISGDGRPAAGQFVGLIFWRWVWGVWGMMLAVPMMMIAKAVCDHIEDLQPIGRFLGD